MTYYFGSLEVVIAKLRYRIEVLEQAALDVAEGRMLPAELKALVDDYHGEEE